ncbi:helix-turn-helix domain-containing protein [Nocardia xishanensis]
MSFSHGIRLPISSPEPTDEHYAQRVFLARTGRTRLSNQLACLRGRGLVVAVPEGRRSRYELADARIAAALEDLPGLVLAVDPTCCPAADNEGCC